MEIQSNKSTKEATLLKNKAEKLSFEIFKNKEKMKEIK